MAATPCEGERRKGASPMDGARGPLNMDVNWPGPPFVVRQADGVAVMRSLATNIYAFKLTNYYFWQGIQY
jgi:hypothetical protein